MQTSLEHPSCSEFKAVFTNLPCEIIAKILDVLDWASLLKTRQVCKHLDAISRTRTVWESQYHQYTAERIWPTRLEAPLESYSADDLERWVLMRRSADVGWKREDVKSSRARTIGHTGVAGVCIVPGGRWLLVGGMVRGAVTVYDLEAGNPAGEPLIPPDEQEESVHAIAVTVASAQESPNLEFTMALSTGVHFAWSAPTMSIWRVALTSHYHNIAGISIHEDFCARILVEEISCIEVVDWKRSSSSVHHNATLTIVPGARIESFRLLPGNRLVVFCGIHLMIYGFDGSEAIAPTTAPAITQPMWKTSLPSANARLHRGVSPGLSNHLATHFLLISGTLIYSLVVPKNDEEPHFVKMTELDEPITTSHVIGFEKAFVHWDGVASHLSFSWGDREIGSINPWLPDSCVEAISDGYPVARNPSLRPQFDEETGRIVHASRDTVHVVDTALIYMPCADATHHPKHRRFPRRPFTTKPSPYWVLPPPPLLMA